MSIWLFREFIPENMIRLLTCRCQYLMPSTSIVPADNGCDGKKQEKTHYQIDQTLRLTTIITLQAMLDFLYWHLRLWCFYIMMRGKVLAQLLMLGYSVVIILYGWSTITNAVLQGLNYLSSPAKTRQRQINVHLGALVLMLTVFKIECICARRKQTFVLYLLLCVFQIKEKRQVCGFRINIRRTFVKPLIASAIMGVITYYHSFRTARLIGGRVIPTVLAIIVAVIVCGVLILN